jgi:hypothetical protein
MTAEGQAAVTMRVGDVLAVDVDVAAAAPLQFAPLMNAERQGILCRLAVPAGTDPHHFEFVARKAGDGQLFTRPRVHKGLAEPYLTGRVHVVGPVP